MKRALLAAAIWLTFATLTTAYTLRTLNDLDNT